jgi:hypothetical protein
MAKAQTRLKILLLTGKVVSLDPGLVSDQGFYPHQKYLVCKELLKVPSPRLPSLPSVPANECQTEKSLEFCGKADLITYQYPRN